MALFSRQAKGVYASSLPAQLLLELARPWGVIARQLATMVEPFFTPEERCAIRRQMEELLAPAPPKPAQEEDGHTALPGADTP